MSIDSLCAVSFCWKIRDSWPWWNLTWWSHWILWVFGDCWIHTRSLILKKDTSFTQYTSRSSALSSEIFQAMLCLKDDGFWNISHSSCKIQKDWAFISFTRWSWTVFRYHKNIKRSYQESERWAFVQNSIFHRIEKNRNPESDLWANSRRWSISDSMKDG